MYALPNITFIFDNIHDIEKKHMNHTLLVVFPLTICLPKVYGTYAYSILMCYLTY